MNIDALYAALPAVIGDDAALDRVLRRLGRIREWDGAGLGAIRAIAIQSRIVVRNEFGTIVKGKLPEPKTFVEAENERIAKQAADEREMFFASMKPPPYSPDGLRIIQPDDPDHPANQPDPRIAAAVARLIAPLEQQVTELRELVERLAVTHELAA